MKRIKKSISSTKKLLKRRWKLILLLLIIGGGIIFWQINKANSTTEDIEFQQVERKDLVKTIEVSGVVDAKQRARLRFVAGGKVVYLGAQEGEWVKKWQTIATIDKAALEKQLEQDLNTYMSERWDWEDTQDTTDYHLEDLSTRKAIDKEQWNLEDTVLNVEIRDIAIRNSSLYSPFDGILVTSPTNVSGVQLLSTDYFEVVNPQSLIFRAEVDEDDVGLIQINQPADFELDAYEDEVMTSYVNYISFTSFQSTSGTVYLIEMPIDSENIDKFRIGMNGDVTIKVDERQAVLAIPIEATISRENSTTVQVKTGENTFEDREIEVGMETDDEVEVLSGLSESDYIVIPE